MTDLPQRRVASELVLTSFLALFLEMAAVRWFHANVQAIGLFSNIVVISSFLGLGLGCLAARRRSLVAGSGLLLAVLAALGPASGPLGFQPALPTTYVGWAGGSAFSTPVSAMVVPILVSFALNTAIFVPLGQALGRRFEAVRAATGKGGALRSYALDIVGSLLGVLVFAAASALGAPPVTWFALAGLLALVLVEGRTARFLNLLAVGLALLLVIQQGGADRWSPYYRVRTHPVLAESRGQTVTVAHVVEVDGTRIQDAISFLPELDATPLAPWRGYYRLPYHFFTPRKVLVLGAGCGNDIVAALDAGATDVVAVEIDPVIADLGHTLHARRPYDDKRVRVVVDDARAYLARTDERFDLVVMSALDSHQAFTGTLRLESFVYTVECFRAVRKVLAPGGAFVLNLMSGRPWMGPRAFLSLAEAWGEPPRSFTSAHSPFNSIALISGGPPVLVDSMPRVDGVQRVALSVPSGATALATDDWPHLYLETPSVPGIYLAALAAILGASALSVVAAVPSGSRRLPSPHFLLLGCGFMLLETRSMTALALLLGSTWYVSAVVIGAVLLVILAANGAVASGRAPSRRTAYLLLMASLLVGWAFPLDRLLDLGLAARAVAGAVYAGAPVFFAALVFSDSFARAKDLDAALGANLLGAVLGGALEYVSMLTGLRALFLLALAVYALSALALNPWARSAPEASRADPPSGDAAR
jgi:hypothetical protein